MPSTIQVQIEKLLTFSTPIHHLLSHHARSIAPHSARSTAQPDTQCSFLDTSSSPPSVMKLWTVGVIVIWLVVRSVDEMPFRNHTSLCLIYITFRKPIFTMMFIHNDLFWIFSSERLTVLACNCSVVRCTDSTGQAAARRAPHWLTSLARTSCTVLCTLVLYSARLCSVQYLTSSLY